MLLHFKSMEAAQTSLQRHSLPTSKMFLLYNAVVNHNMQMFVVRYFASYHYCHSMSWCGVIIVYTKHLALITSDRQITDS